MKQPDSILSLCAEIPARYAEEISVWLAENELFASVWEDREGGPCKVEVFMPHDAGDPDWARWGYPAYTPKEAEEILARAASSVGISVATELVPIPKENWTESWKRFFTTVRISPRITVSPPWERYEASPGENVIILDPGMSFGTGKHATTRACISFIDSLAAEDSGRDFLDIGCGSGILSIAAAKLGFSPVTSVDNDPDAVRIAAENASANNAHCRFKEGDLAFLEDKAAVVAANVLAPVLIEHARSVAGSVKRVEGNALILSGILESQYGEVKSVYESLGFRERETILAGEWKSGLFTLAEP